VGTFKKLKVIHQRRVVWAPILETVGVCQGTEERAEGVPRKTLSGEGIWFEK